MTVPRIFATQPAGNVPASYLDEDFAAVAQVATTRLKLTTSLTIAVPGDFASIQSAIDHVSSLDLNGQSVAITLASGTYAGFVINQEFVGQRYDGIQIIGDIVTPSNVVIAETSANCVQVSNGAILTLGGLKLTNTTFDGIYVTTGGQVYTNGLMDFGAIAGLHINVFQEGYVSLGHDYTISGGGTVHMHCAQGGLLLNSSKTITISAPVTFSSYFVGVAGPGMVQCIGLTFVNPGNVTGQRYLCHNNALLDIGNIGASPTYFPGTSNGFIETFGVYDYTTGFVGINYPEGTVPISPFQVLLASDVSIRVLNFGAGVEIDAANKAQSGLLPLYFGSTNTNINSTGAGFVGAAIVSPFQWAVSSAVVIRSTTSGSGATLDATNAAQNAFAPLSFNASSLSSNIFLTALSSTAVASGAATQAFVKASSTADLGIYYGTGVPSFSAAQGSLYTNVSASSSTTRVYVNTNGTTGWASFTASS